MDNNACYIASIFGQTSSGGTAVFINSAGKLGTTTSSRRFKEGIKPMADASEVILALQPVTFRYKKEIEPSGISQFGLVAEDVEAVNPDLVVRDQEGKVNTVRYEAINAMLLNEFLKEHKAFVDEQCRVREQEATIEELTSRIANQEKGMHALVQQIQQQAAAIQRVTTQLELSKPPFQAAMAGR
jgi:uncharacterized coiled-coil protein SlyX